MSEVTLESQLIEIIKDEDMAENIKLAKVDMLIRLGVDVNALYGARSSLRFAKYNNLKKVAELLENNGAQDVFDKKKANKLGVELCEICEREAKGVNVAEIKELIDMGADVRAEDTEGNTALMRASFWGHRDVAEVLIQKGADVNATDSNGETALMLASFYGYKEIAELLIKAGADVSAEDIKCNTALRGASKNGHKEVVELLIQNGANVSVTDNVGLTALMWSSYRGHKEVVELLIQKGADVNAKDYIGRNAVMIAKDEKTRRAIIDAVKNRNEKIGENVVIHGFERE